MLLSDENFIESHKYATIVWVQTSFSLAMFSTPDQANKPGRASS